MKTLLLCGGVFSISILVNAQGLTFPVDCRLGVDCFIQQYVDRDPGPGTADFACGPLTYEGHRGTDIRLIDDAAINAGVDVLAAAPGLVKGVRDNLPDQRQGTPGAPDVTSRECGNGILVERSDGWRFQYCHLRGGSVRVRKGDIVAAGDVLGEIGLSGKTQFPHLHITVRDSDGTVIDPFDARPQDAACDLPDTQSLWSDLDADAYQPGGILTAGFLDRIPDYEEIKTGAAGANDLSVDADALVFWAHFFGPRDGDELTVRLTGPDGQTIAEETAPMSKNRAQQFKAVGRRLRRAAWPEGTYLGTALMIRDGAEIDRVERQLILE